MADETTTIQVRCKTKERLDVIKLCKDESYESLIVRLLDEREKNGEAQ